jgi:tetratricopeptide (TPR) repeat protein
MTTRALHTRSRPLAAAVFVLAWFAYGIALCGDYVFDDIHSVSANAVLHDLSQFGRLLTDPSAFSATGQRMYRPLLLVSFALNIALSSAAWSLKAGNVLLHAAVASMLFAWLRRLDVRRGVAFAVAAVFAVHPLASETVNLVSARSELLLAFGLMIALHGHMAWQARRLAPLGMIGIVCGTAIACGSKETGVMVPVLLCAQAWWTRPEDWRTRWQRTIVGVMPAAVLALGYLLLRRELLGQATVDLLSRSGDDPTAGCGRSLLAQLATMGTLLPEALRLVVWPAGLSLAPPVTFRTSFADPIVLLGWASIVGLTVAAVCPGPTARHRRLGAFLAWSLALPWIVVPLNVPLAEHRLYGPMLGLGLVAAVLLAAVPRVHVAWRGALATAVGVGIALSAMRSFDYRDEITLWRREVAAQPDSFPVQWGLGAAMLRTGDAASAIEPLATAIAIRPQNYDALQHYVEALVSLADDRAEPYRALVAADRLAERRSEDPWVRTLQAQAHLQAGRVFGDASHFEAAERLALSCLQIATPKGYVFRLAASARRGLDDLDGALAHLDESLRRGLDDVTVRLDRAAVLRALGRDADARSELLRAQRQAPMDPGVLRALYGASAGAAAQPPR